jgi:Fe-S cluster biogenesis protein NfuA
MTPEATPKEPSATVQERVEAVLERIRPYVRKDGGDVELANINLEDGILFLRLRGACSSCPSSIYTLQMGIESEIRQEVPEIKQVIAV